MYIFICLPPLKMEPVNSGITSVKKSVVIAFDKRKRSNVSEF